jgi:hypothetical protein
MQASISRQRGSASRARLLRPAENIAPVVAAAIACGGVARTRHQFKPILRLSNLASLSCKIRIAASAVAASGSSHSASSAACDASSSDSSSLHMKRRFFSCDTQERRQAGKQARTHTRG